MSKNINKSSSILSSEDIEEDFEDEYFEDDEIFEDEENIEDIEDFEDEEEDDNNKDVEEELVEDADDELVEDVEEELVEDTSYIIDEIVDDKVVQQRKREFNIDKEKIKKQMLSFKLCKAEDIKEEIKKEISIFTSSEKNINIFLNNILSKGDSNQTLNILRFIHYKDLSLKDILNSIKEDNYSFNNNLWEPYREEIKKEVNRLQTKVEVAESYIECPKCKQKKIQFYNVQLRRADEPPTTFNNCMNKNCMYSWRTG